MGVCKQPTTCCHACGAMLRCDGPGFKQGVESSEVKSIDYRYRKANCCQGCIFTGARVNKSCHLPHSALGAGRQRSCSCICLRAVPLEGQRPACAHLSQQVPQAPSSTLIPEGVLRIVHHQHPAAATAALQTLPAHPVPKQALAMMTNVRLQCRPARRRPSCSNVRVVGGGRRRRTAATSHPRCVLLLHSLESLLP